MSNLTTEQEAVAARRDEIYRAQVIRTNAIATTKTLYAQTRRTRGAEHTPLLATLEHLDKALTVYESSERETSVPLHAVYAEVFTQTVERLEFLAEQRELVTPA